MSVYEDDPNVVMVDGTFYPTKVEVVAPATQCPIVRRRKLRRAAKVTQEAARSLPMRLATDSNFGVGATGPTKRPGHTDLCLE